MRFSREIKLHDSGGCETFASGSVSGPHGYRSETMIPDRKMDTGQGGQVAREPTEGDGLRENPRAQ